MSLVIVATSQKGGGGKSTFIRNLALMRAAAGYRVCLIDGDDRQNTIDKWYSRREDFGYTSEIDYNSRFNLIVENSDLLNGAINQSIDMGCDSVLVDLPGRFDTPLAQMILRADICICPISGSPDDYDVLPYMSRIMERANKYKKNGKLYVIHNRANSNANRRNAEYEDLKYQCSKSKALDLMEPQFREAVAFKDSAKFGLALFEYANIKSSNITTSNNNLMSFNNLYEFIWKEEWVKLSEE